MNDKKFTTKLLGLQGIDVLYCDENNGIVRVYVASAYSFAMCPKCKRLTQQVHDKRLQAYRHLDIWGNMTIVFVITRRFVCGCSPEHPFDESFSFIRKHQRQTIPFEKYVFSLCKGNTIKNVAELVGFSQGRVQRIFNYYAENHLKHKEKAALIYVGIDDIAVRKGHHYKTVIYNQDTGEVVAIINGRTKEDVVKFLQKELTRKERNQVKGVAMDMSKAYLGAALECFPNALPVIDRFHIAKHLHDQVDAARKHIQNKVRKEQPDNKQVFNIRWSMLKNFEDLEPHETERLLSVCDEHPQLKTCLELKEEFRRFFKLRCKDAASAFIDYYTTLVEESGIKELVSFCNTLNNWREYILNFYDCEISNGPTEGSNNKIKMIKRKGFGYRNDHNFLLRVKLEFCA